MPVSNNAYSRPNGAREFRDIQDSSGVLDGSHLDSNFNDVADGINAALDAANPILFKKEAWVLSVGSDPSNPGQIVFDKTEYDVGTESADYLAAGDSFALIKTIKINVNTWPTVDWSATPDYSLKRELDQAIKTGSDGMLLLQSADDTGTGTASDKLEGDEESIRMRINGGGVDGDIYTLYVKDAGSHGMLQRRDSHLWKLSLQCQGAILPLESSVELEVAPDNTFEWDVTEAPSAHVMLTADAEMSVIGLADGGRYSLLLNDSDGHELSFAANAAGIVLPGGPLEINGSANLLQVAVSAGKILWNLITETGKSIGQGESGITTAQAALIAQVPTALALARDGIPELIKNSDSDVWDTLNLNERNDPSLITVGRKWFLKVAAAESELNGKVIRRNDVAFDHEAGDHGFDKYYDVILDGDGGSGVDQTARDAAAAAQATANTADDKADTAIAAAANADADAVAAQATADAALPKTAKAVNTDIDAIDATDTAISTSLANQSSLDDGDYVTVRKLVRALARVVKTASTTIRGMVLLARNEDVDATATDTSRVVTVASATRLFNRLKTALLPKSGGTMTGKITLDGPPTADLHAATKGYVDANSGAGGRYSAYHVKIADYTATLADNRRMIWMELPNAQTSNLDLTLPNAGLGDAGFYLGVYKQSPSNHFGTITVKQHNGSTLVTLHTQGQFVEITWGGAYWNVIAEYDPANAPLSDAAVLDLAASSRGTGDRGKALGTSESDEDALALLEIPANPALRRGVESFLGDATLRVVEELGKTIIINPEDTTKKVITLPPVLVSHSGAMQRFIIQTGAGETADIRVPNSGSIVEQDGTSVTKLAFSDEHNGHVIDLEVIGADKWRVVNRFPDAPLQTSDARKERITFGDTGRADADGTNTSRSFLPIPTDPISVIAGTGDPEFLSGVDDNPNNPHWTVAANVYLLYWTGTIRTRENNNTFRIRLLKESNDDLLTETSSTFLRGSSATHQLTKLMVLHLDVDTDAKLTIQADSGEVNADGNSSLTFVRLTGDPTSVAAIEADLQTLENTVSELQSDVSSNTSQIRVGVENAERFASDLVANLVFGDAGGVTEWPEDSPPADDAPQRILVSETLSSTYTVPAANTKETTDQNLTMNHEPGLYELTTGSGVNQIEIEVGKSAAIDGGSDIDYGATLRVFDWHQDQGFRHVPPVGKVLHSPLGSGVSGFAELTNGNTHTTYAMLLEESLWQVWTAFGQRTFFAHMNRTQQDGTALHVAIEMGGSNTVVRVHGVSYRVFSPFAAISSAKQHFLKQAYEDNQGDTAEAIAARKVVVYFNGAANDTTTRFFLGNSLKGYTLIETEYGTERPVLSPSVRHLSALSKTDYNGLSVKDANTIYVVDGVGVYHGSTLVAQPRPSRPVVKDLIGTVTSAGNTLASRAWTIPSGHQALIKNIDRAGATSGTDWLEIPAVNYMRWDEGYDGIVIESERTGAARNPLTSVKIPFHAFKRPDDPWSGGMWSNQDDDNHKIDAVCEQAGSKLRVRLHVGSHDNATTLKVYLVS